MKKILYVLIVIIALYTACTSMIMAFKNPKLTQTELFLLIPKSLLLDFKQQQ